MDRKFIVERSQIKPSSLGLYERSDDPKKGFMPFIKIIAVVFFLFHICIGIFVLYNIFAPEIAYEPTEIKKEIEEKYEEEIPEQNMMVIPKTGVEMKIGEPEHYLDFSGWVQEINCLPCR